MKRHVGAFLAVCFLLLTALTVLAFVLPKHREPATLSVLTLRQGEGNAVLVSCGGQTLLLPMGGEADRENLAKYLQKKQLHIVRVIDAAETDPATITLGDAVCRMERTDSETLQLTLSHGNNEMCLRLLPEQLPELLMQDGECITLETDRHSVRIFSDGTHVRIRPDFSAWDE